MAWRGSFVIGQTKPTRSGLINGWAHCVLAWKTSGTAWLWPRESFREMSASSPLCVLEPTLHFSCQVEHYLEGLVHIIPKINRAKLPNDKWIEIFDSFPELVITVRQCWKYMFAFLCCRQSRKSTKGSRKKHYKRLDVATPSKKTKKLTKRYNYKRLCSRAINKQNVLANVETGSFTYGVQLNSRF